MLELVDDVFPPKAKPNPVDDDLAGDDEEVAEFPNENVGFEDVPLALEAGAENENNAGAGALVEGGNSGLLCMLDVFVELLVNTPVAPPKPPKVDVLDVAAVEMLAIAVELVVEDCFDPFNLL